MKLFIVSGISGAGKSTVLYALEDLGFYCIDNLPVALLPAFAKELLGSPKHYSNAAVGIDARNLANDLSVFPDLIGQLHAAGVEIRIVFLDADDGVVITRFSETRRMHPLTRGNTPLAEAIRQERALLSPISSRADLTIDTSRTNIHQLRELVRDRLGQTPGGRMSILFESFGFKHGIPVDADFVFDVRCLPNPHWDPQLRALTGRSPEVIEFLGRDPQVERMFNDIAGFLATWIPRFEADNRSYMTVAVGCTGGQHRSVYFTERLSQYFRNRDMRVLTRHRELS
ncbi:MAG: RNase adapter RapZ [Thiohalomonadaceae bacterium]